MPFVFSDSLRNEILEMYKEAEKHAPSKEEKEIITKLRIRVEKMPKWRPGALFSND